MSKPKTFGSQSELNTKNKEKTSGKIKTTSNKPWYRKQNKVNFQILKNPHKYITTGNI